MTSANRTHDPVIEETRAWVNRAVIGLNLCPFAKAPQVKGLVRYVHSAATDPAALLADLVDELERLAMAPPDKIETTLLVHPGALGDFLAYNEFLAVAEETVAELDLEGVLQVASFHPDYQFEDAGGDDIGNATNRSPFPTLHLLREDSIAKAVAAFPDAEDIYQANIETLQKLGAAGWADLRRRCRHDAELQAENPTTLAMDQAAAGTAQAAPPSPPAPAPSPPAPARSAHTPDGCRGS